MDKIDWGHWKFNIRDYKNPLSEIELKFIRLGIIKLQKFTDSDEPRESHKPVLQGNIDRVKKHLSLSGIVMPDPSYTAYYW